MSKEVAPMTDNEKRTMLLVRAVQDIELTLHHLANSSDVNQDLIQNMTHRLQTVIYPYTLYAPNVSDNLTELKEYVEHIHQSYIDGEASLHQ